MSCGSGGYEGPTFMYILRNHPVTIRDGFVMKLGEEI